MKPTSGLTHYHYPFAVRPREIALTLFDVLSSHHPKPLMTSSMVLPSSFRHPTVPAVPISPTEERFFFVVAGGAQQNTSSLALSTAPGMLQTASEKRQHALNDRTTVSAGDQPHVPQCLQTSPLVDSHHRGVQHCHQKGLEHHEFRVTISGSVSLL